MKMETIMAQAAAPAPLRPEWLDHLGNALATLTGDWVRTETVVGITWLQLLLGLAVLILTAVVVEVVRQLARHKIEKVAQAEAATAGESGFASFVVEADPGGRVAAPFISGPVDFGTIWRVLDIAAIRTGRLLKLARTALGWVKQAGLMVAVFWFLFRMLNVVERELRRWAARSVQKWDDALVALIVRALRLVTPLMAVILILPTLKFPAEYHNLIQQVASLFLIGGVGFILYDLTASTERIVLTEYRMDVKDNLTVRKIQTQVRMLKKIAVTLIIIITAASMLTVFDSVRRLGTSILASAGVAGIIVGFAAQRSLATLVAGVQIAFTQPIRLDDVVIVEGEWGRVEEITLTYVVVHIWDLRRLIVPLSYFIEKPFQNWTRVSADLIGSVFLYVDYVVPLSALRSELDRILGESNLWDHKVKVLQVTDAKEQTLELRVLASAADSSSAWDLRCEIREKLVDYLQRNYPGSLPRMRAELQPLFPANGANEFKREEILSAAPP